MANSDEHPARLRGPVRIDAQTTLSLTLVMALVGALVVGAMQYGRQSERLDSVERELAKVTAKLEKLTDAIDALKTLPDRR
jgi:hypothetical protein